MRVRASLWATMAAVTLLSPAVLIARLADMDVGHVLAARYVFLPKHPPLPQPRKSAPVPPPEERAQVQPPAPAPAAAPATFLPLGMARDRPEEIAQVPDHFFWLRNNVMAAQDAVDGQLVFFDDAGRVTSRTILPSDFQVGEVAAGPGAVRLIDRAGRRQMSIARIADPAALRSLQVTPVAADRSTRTARVTRSSPEVLQLQDESDTRARPLEVRSLTNAPLAQAYEIPPESGQSRYVVTEEIAATSPAIRVDIFVRRYASSSGELTGVVYVPLDGFQSVPHDFISVGADGVVRVLAPTVTGVTIREYEFAAPPRGRVAVQDLKSLGRNPRAVNVETRLWRGDPLDQFRNPNEPQIELVLLPPPPITRAAILANARAYLDVNWTMQAENFSRLGIDNVCTPREGRIWLRPRHFTPDLIGKTIAPMPYKWGGDDTPNTFRIRTEWGALAGSLCTCRQPEFNYCVFADSAGIDCSGFVSRAWGIEKRGTAGLLDVADEVKSLDALEPGDAFDWPQRHVRLYVGRAEGAEMAFKVLEASTRIECEGVCEMTYRPSELEGYRIIRYRNIREDNVAANGNGTPSAAPAASPAPEQQQPAPQVSGEKRAPAKAKPTPKKRIATKPRKVRVR